MCVLQVLMNSNLPLDTLGKIWELSDHDKDGQLDAEEFAVVRLSVDCSIYISVVGITYLAESQPARWLL